MSEGKRLDLDLPTNDTAASSKNYGSKMESELTQTFLNLERINPLLYKSSHHFLPFGGRGVYGGQVVGQALVAASNTIPADRHMHSLHCYFLRPGNADHPILYHVQKTRDGRTYSNRFVEATQQGKSIFTMMVSVKLPEENTYCHQYQMPDVPPPEECAELKDILKQRLRMNISEKEQDYIRDFLTEEMAILRKPVDPFSYYGGEQRGFRQFVWMKAKGHIGPNQQMQNCAAAYMSDSMLLGTTLLPSQWGMRDSKFIVGSLDHALWFHHPVKADDWLLYETQSPQCGFGLSTLIGRMWDRHGKLVITACQGATVKPITDNFWEGQSSGACVANGWNPGHLGSTGRKGAEAPGRSKVQHSKAVISTGESKEVPKMNFGQKPFSALLPLVRNVFRFVLK